MSRSRLFFLLFPLAIFLMVAGSVLITFIVKPGVNEGVLKPEGYGVRIEAPGTEDTRFWITEGRGLPSERDPLLVLKDPGVVMLEESHLVTGEAFAIRVALEARLSIRDAAGLEDWLNFELKNAALLGPEERNALAGGSGSGETDDGALMAEALMAWNAAPAEIPATPINSQLWLQEDFRALLRASLREIVGASASAPAPGELEERLGARFPDGLVRVRVFEATPTGGAAGDGA